MNTFKIFSRIGLLAVFCLMILAFQLKAFDFVGKWWSTTFKTEPVVTNSLLASASGDLIETAGESKIQVAFLLDTSSSMDGLIDQAKSQLWGILNELAAVRKDGETPVVEVSLYEYGNAGLPVTKGFIRQVMPFSRDVDQFSDELFKLTTDGGSEYCTTVIQTALSELNWSRQKHDLRLVYIAGNESFNQAELTTEDMLDFARQKDVDVTTIFCGNKGQGEMMGWFKGSTANGDYFSIDQDQATVYRSSPYDDQINLLNDRLNATYIPFGEQGQEYQLNLMTQDANAASYSTANKVDRAAFKCSKGYFAGNWDLVDAYEKDKEIVKEAKNLPKEFADLSEEKLVLKIQELAKERTVIEEEIVGLNTQRQAYIHEQIAAESGVEQQNLCKSIVAPMKKVAKQKGYEVE